MKLNQLRVDINKIDAGIITLLDRRFQASQKIRMLKKETSLAIRAPIREREVLINADKLAQKHGIDKKFIRNLFNLIIAESVKVQKEIK